MKVFIGCSQYNDIDKKYFDTAKKVSNSLINHNCTLVFGGASSGLMGCVYNSFKEKNVSIYAIQTEHYKYELDKLDCNKKVVSTTLNQMEEFMNNSDLLMYLPGGFGTYNEIFYMICEYINETHNKKIVIINIDHYFDGLIEIIEKIKREKFAKKFDFITFINSIDELDKYMEDIC